MSSMTRFSNRNTGGNSGRYRNNYSNDHYRGNNGRRQDMRSNRGTRFKSNISNERTYKNVIPFEPDYDESKLVMVKFTKTETIDGQQEKTTVQVPRLSEDCTHFELLKFVKEFNAARQQLNWNDG